MSSEPATWIRTYSGGKYDLLHPRASQVCLDDLAHALAGERRFANHCRGHYSVAEHSLRVSWIVSREPVMRLKALLHDAAEAYLSDWSSPLKNLLRIYSDGWALELEARSEAAIATAFGLENLHEPEIKIADRVMLATEQRDLMAEHDPSEWTHSPLDDVIIPMGEDLARRLWRTELTWWLDARARSLIGSTPGANVRANLKGQ